MNKKCVWITGSALVLVLILGGILVMSLGEKSVSVSADSVASEKVVNAEALTIDNGQTQVTAGQTVSYEISVNLSDVTTAVSKEISKNSGASSNTSNLLGEIKQRIKDGNLYLVGVLGNVVASSSNSKVEKAGTTLNTRLWMSEGTQNTETITYVLKTTVPSVKSDGTKKYYSKVGLYYRSGKHLSTSKLGTAIDTILSGLFSKTDAKMLPISIAEQSSTIAATSYNTADLTVSKLEVQTKDVYATETSTGSNTPDQDARVKVIVTNLGKNDAKMVHVAVTSSTDLFGFVATDLISLGNFCDQTTNTAYKCQKMADLSVGAMAAGSSKTFYVPVKLLDNATSTTSQITATISTADTAVMDPVAKNNSMSVTFAVEQ